MKFSYSAVWDDTVRLIRANAVFLAALAGAFIFLPELLTAYLLPPPEPTEISQVGPRLIEYFTENWVWFLITSLISMVGAIAIYLLLLGRGGMTVAGLITAAAALVPFYFLASLSRDFSSAWASLLLILPGIYAAGRLAMVAPIVAAENQRNPIEAIRRSLELTKGKGWAVIGLLIIVLIAGALINIAVTTVLGLVFNLVGGDGIGRFLSLVLSSLTGAILSTILLVLLASIYRALAQRDSTATVFD